jgi:hypothetical protein
MPAQESTSAPEGQAVHGDQARKADTLAVDTGKAALWRRRLKLLVWCIFATQIAVSALILWPRSYPFTTKDCERIHDGMTRAEVQAILGRLPPGDYRTGLGRDHEFEVTVYQKLKTGLQPVETVECWQSDDVQLVVIFDKNGRVCSKLFGHTYWSLKDVFRDLWSRVARITGLADRRPLCDANSWEAFLMDRKDRWFARPMSTRVTISPPAWIPAPDCSHLAVACA